MHSVDSAMERRQVSPRKSPPRNTARRRISTPLLNDLEFITPRVPPGRAARRSSGRSSTFGCTSLSSIDIRMYVWLTVLLERDLDAGHVAVIRVIDLRRHKADRRPRPGDQAHQQARIIEVEVRRRLPALQALDDRDPLVADQRQGQPAIR